MAIRFGTAVRVDVCWPWLVILLWMIDTGRCDVQPSSLFGWLLARVGCPVVDGWPGQVWRSSSELLFVDGYWPGLVIPLWMIDSGKCDDQPSPLLGWLLARVGYPVVDGWPGQVWRSPSELLFMDGYWPGLGILLWMID